MFVPIIIGQELVLTRGAGASVIVDEAKRCSCCCDTVKTKTAVHKIDIYLFNLLRGTFLTKYSSIDKTSVSSDITIVDTINFVYWKLHLTIILIPTILQNKKFKQILPNTHRIHPPPTIHHYHHHLSSNIFFSIIRIYEG